MIALVRRCYFQMSRLTDIMQVIFAWLVICSRASSSIRIQVDGTLLGRRTELRIHILCDAGHGFASCNYLCRKVYQSLHWLVSGSLRFGVNIGNKSESWSYKILIGLRGYVSFHNIFRIFRSWITWNCDTRLKQYLQYVVEIILTDVSLTFSGLDDLDNVHWYRWRVRWFDLSTTRDWCISDFLSCEYGDVWKFYHTMVAGQDIELDRSSSVSEHKKLTMLAVCILIDIVHATPYVSTSSFHI